MTIIKTRNSSTASAVPTAGNLVQGELAVNVADKRLFTEDNAAQIIEIGTNPTSITTGAITASGTVTANGQFVNGNALLTGGSINNIIIGNSTAAAVTGTVVTASTGFVGGLTGNVTGNLTGNTTGNVTGNVTGNLTGNVTASSGTTSLHNLSLTGTVDFNTARLTDIGTPTAATDAVTKAYADGLITNLIDGAPAALDTLNELASAMADDASFHTTVTNSIATKLPLAGGTMTGAINMGAAKISNLATPTSAQDAATKAYTDAQVSGGLPTSGGTMTGAIAMSTNKITGMGDPTAAQDATTKTYVDGILGSATSAATSAAAALVSQNAAATSAATATTQAGISTTKAGEASTSATSAAASFDSFDDRYLGAKASDPSVDNDGDALVTGALVFNTTSATMKVYGGSSWSAVAPTATSVTLSQVTDFPTQSGQSGKYLTTNGSVPSWGTLSTDSTLATLTKTFTAGETSTLTLTANAVAPVVAVTKEVTQSGVTNNAWDAAASTYTFENSAPATTLNFNPDISGATYDSKNTSVAVQENQPRGFTFNSDGSKMFVVGTQRSEIFQYSLSTDFDVSTASYDSLTKNVYPEEPAPHGLAFNADGTKFFVVGTTNDTVFEYTCSVGFDLSSTVAYSGNSFSVATQEPIPYGLTFSTDGTRFYVVGNTNSTVYEYTCSVGFDLSSTVAYSNNSFSVATQEGNPQDIFFNASGSKFYIVGLNEDKVFEYTCSTAFDLGSTVAYSGNSFSVSGQESSPSDLYINDSKLFLLGTATDTVFEYNLSTKLGLGTGTFAAADVGKTIYANSGSVVLTSTSGDYTVLTALSSTNQVASGNWTMFGAVYDSTADVLKPSGVAGAGFDLSVAAYTGDTNAVNILRGFCFGNNGTKMYTIQCNDAGIGNINEYTLSTPYLVSSGVYVTGFSVLSQDDRPRGVAISPDGTKLWMVGHQTDDLFLYNLSTAFDLSTQSYSSTSISFSSTTGIPTGMTWSPDGTRFYLCEQQYGYVIEYAASTAFDITTINVNVQASSKSIGATETQLEGVAISADGTKMFITGGASDKVHEYSLPTAFSLTGATLAQSFSVASQTNVPQDVQFTPDGSYMYVCSSISGIWQYSTAAVTTATGYQPAIASTIDSTYWTDINSLTATNVVGDGNVFYAISNDAKANWSILDNSNGVRKIVKNNSGTYQVNTNATYSSETWANAATNTEVAALRESMTSATALNGYQLSAAAYDSKSFNFASQDNQCRGVRFNLDGTKMYMNGVTADGFFQYSLSTAYDVSTASYDSVSFTGSEDGNMEGFCFNNDGTKIFGIGLNNFRIYQYTLSTAFDLSTMSYSSVSFLISGQDNSPRDIGFNNDGTKMFLIGRQNDSLLQYSLSTAYDLSTASYDSVSFSVAAQEANPSGFIFSADGTKMFVTGTSGDDINAYDLSTAFDITTATYDTNFSVSGQVSNPQGIATNGNGTKMYIIDNPYPTAMVYQYSTATTSYPNQMTSTELNAITDANQITLGSALDFATILYYASGSTIPTYSGTAINYDANVLNNGAVLGTDYNYDAPAQNKVRVTSVNAANLKIRVV